MRFSKALNNLKINNDRDKNYFMLILNIYSLL